MSQTHVLPPIYPSIQTLAVRIPDIWACLLWRVKARSHRARRRRYGTHHKKRAQKRLRPCNTIMLCNTKHNLLLLLLSVVIMTFEVKISASDVPEHNVATKFKKFLRKQKVKLLPRTSSPVTPCDLMCRSTGPLHFKTWIHRVCPSRIGLPPRHCWLATCLPLFKH